MTDFKKEFNGFLYRYISTFYSGTLIYHIKERNLQIWGFKCL